MSLLARQYYAHPRNTFWRIMEEVVGLRAGESYEERIRLLSAHGIALWDVLHSCNREGSLDTAIRSGSVSVNDFVAFFRQHPQVDSVLFNGAAAERYYNRHVLPKLGTTIVNHLRMPSTSPAHASMSFEQKVAAWRQGIGGQKVQPTEVRARK